MLDHSDTNETEEFHKNLVSGFLINAFYSKTHFINTKGRQDLVIHNGKDNKHSVGVIIEAKRPKNKGDWFTPVSPNSKALQELVLYYLRERVEAKNIDIKYLIATNIDEWYIIEASYFDKLFYQNKKLVKDYEEWRDGKKVTKDTSLFYKDIAGPVIDGISDEIPCTYFNLKDHEKSLRSNAKDIDKDVIALFKILSPYHLLKVGFANDSNELDQNFYKELLHIIGLEEAKDGGKNIIRRKVDNRNIGSLLEKAIDELKTEGLHKIPDLKSFGETAEEQYFAVALELSITWINRVLFLKLLEGQLINYHKGNQQYRFLNSGFINDFDELFKLFHKVLAVDVKSRNPAIQEKFNRVPYLNSSLFEISDLEDVTIKINAIDSNDTLEYIGTTILKDQKKKGIKLNTLEYLFQFLDAYDFASEGTSETQEDNKTLINASVLGKVFEKINGYKDGSIYTPGFITMYMSRQSIRLAVLQKFNDAYGWSCKEFAELENLIEYQQPEARNKANAIINDLKICDPAVGSGHFLVSALNEIIAIKSELKILQDVKGKRLKEYSIEVVNDELLITDEDNDLFVYTPQSAQSQLIQQTLFIEKQTLIENCLFGVDINPNSVKICRLRLWIELLKNAYYKPDGYLETLPNIDINIKSGNSLLSRFALDADLSKALKSIKYDVSAYRGFVNDYKNCKDREVKRGLQLIIDRIKADFRTEIAKNDPLLIKLNKATGELYNLLNQVTIFDEGTKIKKANKIKREKLEADINKWTKEVDEIKNNAIYKNAFEWRFEFPEVLSNNGDYEGFDIVIGNPPYIKEYENRDAFNGLRSKECYQGKMDLWYLFGDLGLTLLKPECYLCYIATNNWVTNAGAANFRNIVVTKSQIINLIDFGAYMIFENASIQTMIMTFKNTFNNDTYNFEYRKLEGAKLNVGNVLDMLSGNVTSPSIKLNATINRKDLLDKPLTFNSDTNSILLNKIKSQQNFHLIERADKTLGLTSELANGIHHHHDVVNKDRKLLLKDRFDIGTGIFVLNHKELKELELTEKELELIKPQYSTKQATKYYTNPVNESWVIYTRSDINKISKITKKPTIDNYPKIKHHLDRFKEVITSDFAPYGLHRARENYFFEGQKIAVVRKCAKEPIFSYSDFACYLPAAFYVIQSERINLKYLTGLLNSKLIAFWLRKKGKMQGNNYQLDKEPLLEIPIYKPNDIETAKVVHLVEAIIKNKEEGLDTISLEQQIDVIIYQLYNLTPEEIAIVEGN